MVSITVPVYNAESTLRRCIESILNQEYRDIELILVNDGSSDSSAEICDEYAEKDLRVKVKARCWNFLIWKEVDFMIERKSQSCCLEFPSGEALFQN